MGQVGGEESIEDLAEGRPKPSQKSHGKKDADKPENQPDAGTHFLTKEQGRSRDPVPAEETILVRCLLFLVR
jgi:hypothetical protein